MSRTSTKKRSVTCWAKLPPIIDSETVAILLGVDVQIVRKMARDGEIPAKKLGKRLWRFEKTALMKAVGVSEGTGV